MITLILAIISGSAALAEPSKKESSAVTYEPKFPKMEVAVEFVGYQGKKFPEEKGKTPSGCTSRFEARVNQNPKTGHELRCGYPGEVSRVNWSYIHTDKEGDHYEVTRQFPFEDLEQETPKKKVVFQGKPLVVFEDKSHRIVLRVHEEKPKKVGDKDASR